MKHRQAIIVLTIFVLIFTVIFTSLLHLRYRTFFSHDWRDEAVDNQIIFNTANGRPLYSTIKGPMIFHRHFRPIFMVCAAPFLFHDEIQTWFLTVALVLGLGAFPIYGFARRRFRSAGLALACAVGYLAWQPLHEVAMGNYDPETLVATFWAMAALSFDSEKKGAFWFWAFMGLICKETMAVVLFGFGIIALVQRRKIVWWLPALIVAPLWFYAAIQWVIPIYHPTFDTIYGRFIGCEHGSFPLCFLVSLFTEPATTLGQIFSREHLILLWGLLRGMAALPLIGFEWLLPAIPVALEIILLKDPHPIRQAHILSGMLPFIFMAGIVGLNRISRLFEKITKNQKATRVLFVTAIVLYFGGSLVFGVGNGIFGAYQNYGNDPQPGLMESNVFSPSLYRYTPEHKRAWETIELIPKTQPAMTNNRFLLALSSRSDLREFGTQTKLDDFEDSQYILVSVIEPRCRTCTYNPLTIDNLEMLAQLVNTNRYRVVRAYPDHVLLIRKDVLGPQQSEAMQAEFFDVIKKTQKRIAYDSGIPFE